MFNPNPTFFVFGINNSSGVDSFPLPNLNSIVCSSTKRVVNLLFVCCNFKIYFGEFYRDERILKYANEIKIELIDFLI